MKDSITLKDHEALTAEAGLHRMFVFKDEKSATFGPPMTSQTRGMFIRDLQEALANGNAIWAKHPHDFAVYEIGLYDIYRGEVKLYDNKNCLGLVQDFKTSLDKTQ